VAVGQVARIRLAVLPTPLAPAPRLAAGLGLRGALWIKRDDLTGFAVAGNKARQLEFLLGEACEVGADVLVTGGSPGSNFLPAVAAAAAYAGVRSVVVVSGAPGASSSHPNLAAAAAWGAELRWTGTADRSSVDATLPVVAAALARDGSRPYVLPRGGATAVGATGYRLAVDEIVEQLGTLPATVVLACGSGGTQAGLVAGVVAHGRPFRVVGASVSRPAGEVGERVLGLAREVSRRLDDPPPEPSDVRVLDARGPGHGLASREGDAAAALALRCEGLVLDPVYTAKALAVVASVAAEGPTVFWHTGGLFDAVAALLGGPR
jgi:1-aminocyclopropane-1-carboxylate deaminase/D-cysteine desulfhydrase-like pyridoxal-dependent ACC family enzyme